MTNVLLISNKRPDDTGGRAEKIGTRKRMLEQRNWEVVVGHVTEPYLHSFLPSIYRCWQLARKENVDVVHSISNPMHLQVIGLAVAFLTRLPWLAEFRDPMVKNPDRKEGTMKMRLAKIVEILTVHFADRVIWMDGIQMQKSYFTDTYPNVPEKRFQELPFLGFEAEKFESAPAENYDSLTITYAGSFYEGWIEPYKLLEGFSMYVEQNNPSQDELTLQFYGDWAEEYQEKAKELEVGEFIQTYDFVPHDQIIPVVKGSDIVVYIGGDDPQNKLSVPSKIWDYMGAKTPILAVVDPSFRVAQLIEENDLGVVIHPENIEEIANSIENIISGEFSNTLNGTVDNEFSRAHKMNILTHVLNSLSKN